MSSTESPRLRDPADVVLDKLCKKAATFTRAKQYLDEIHAYLSAAGTDDMPDGVVSMCAFIASEQLENKDVSIGTARTSSELQWEQFWRALTEVQDLLQKAAESSVQFEYARLPTYTPGCDTCESKHYECIRKIAPSTKCQVCSIRKKVCTRQGFPEYRHRSEDLGVIADNDSWLSDLESESENPRDGSELRKSRKSSLSSKEIKSRADSEDEVLQKMRQVSPAPSKPLPSPTASPKWTTLEDQPSGSHKSAPGQQTLTSDSEKKDVVHNKRPPDSSSGDGTAKKPRAGSDSHASYPKKAPQTGSAFPVVLTGTRPTVLQPGGSTAHRRSLSSAQPRNGSNGFQSGPVLPHASRKRPRASSPASSDFTPDSRVGPDLPPFASSPRARADSEGRILMDSLQKKAREIISHVEAKGCKGVALRLQILDMKTRVVELDKAQKPGSSSSSVSALENIVRRAAKAVVLCSRKDGCPDMELRLMVLDLDTRLSELDKASTH